MRTILWDIVKGLFRLAGKLWPIWLFFAARYAGVWVYTAIITDVMKIPPPYPSSGLIAEGVAIARALGPVLIYAAAAGSVAAGIGGRSPLTLGALGVVASIGLSAWEEYHRLAAWWAYSPAAAWGYTNHLFVYFAVICLLSTIPIIIMGAKNRSWSGIWRFLFNGVRDVKRADSNLHGTSRWQTMDEARKLFAVGGIVVGEAYRPDQDASLRRQGEIAQFRLDDKSTWGTGAQSPLLLFDGGLGAGHCVFFSGSGGMKTTSVAIPAGMMWRDSFVALDPKGELARKVGSVRKAWGRRVVVLDPAGDGGMNVLDWINPTLFDAEINVDVVADWLIGERPKADTGNVGYFRGAAKSLIVTLLCDMLWDESLSADRKTLAEFRARLVTPAGDLKEKLADIHEFSASSLARQQAGALKDIANEQWSGVYGNAEEATRWLSVASLARLVSRGDFHSADLPKGGVDVFVSLPVKVLQSVPAVGRLIVGALLNAQFEANQQHAARTLFCLDEVYQLGPHFGPLLKARDVGRSYGITLAMVYQSPAQLVEQFGKGEKAGWYDSFAVRCYGCAGDDDTAKEIEVACGSYTGEVESQSEGGGSSNRWNEAFGASSSNHGINKSLSEVKLLRADQAKKLRFDEQIVIMKGYHPLRCSRAIYFRRPEMLSMLAEAMP
jgi:type IV secretion system protein VirD4